MKHLKISLFIGLLVLPLTGFSLDISFPAQVDYRGNNLTKVGEMIYRYLGTIKLYKAAYYTTDRNNVYSFTGSFSGVHKLDLSYFRTIKKKQFVKSTTIFLRKNMGENRVNALKSDIDTFNNFYSTVKKGDRYSLIVEASTGRITLLLNDLLVGTLNNKELGRGLLAIWLGPKPIDKKMRQTLLGYR